MEHELNSALVAIYTPEHMRRELEGKDEERALERLLKTRQIHFSKAYMLPECVIGSIMVVSEIADRHRQMVVSYYLNRERLILVAEEEDLFLLEQLVVAVEEEEEDTSSLFFCKFLESMMMHDMEQLQEIESICYKIEEHLISAIDHFEPTADILRYRKQLLMRNFYYQQLADLCDMLAGNEYDFFDEKSVLLITDMGKRADRLYEYSQMLREYLIQIRELCQQQIDLEQNKTMQVLTVVTTIFLPLTLIAGWYGMNFEYMPELKSPYGYWIVLGVSAIIAVSEIIYFRKKKYL